MTNEHTETQKHLDDQIRIALRTLCFSQMYFLEKINKEGKQICPSVDKNGTLSLKNLDMEYEEVEDE